MEEIITVTDKIITGLNELIRIVKPSDKDRAESAKEFIHDIQSGYTVGNKGITLSDLLNKHK